MKELGERVKELLGERRTSPMYKTFIISWCLWNWEFLYTIFIQDEGAIFNKYKMLKLDYLGSLYPNNDIFIWLKSLGGPIFSVALYYYVLSRFQDKIRKRSAQIEIENYSIDNNLQEEKNIRSQLENRGLELNIEKQGKESEAQILKLNDEIKKKNAEIELIKLENQKTLSEKTKNAKEFESREKEYNEVKNKVNDFEQCMKGLKRISSNDFLNYKENYGYFYQTYSLVELRISASLNDYYLTEKGKFFLQKYLLNDEKDDLPF